MNHPLWALNAISLSLLFQVAHAEEITTTELEPTVVNAQRVKGDYTVANVSSSTGLKLSQKNTPQSVTVISRKQMEDLGATTLEEALKAATGMNIYKQSFQYRYQSRGFDIAQIGEDGVNSTVCTMCGNNPHDQKMLTDTALYDHIEIVRGATGMQKAQSEPGGSINAVRKRPTSMPLAEFETSADRYGTVRGTADVSGFINKDAGIRGRLVAVLEKSSGFKKNSDGNKGIIYGVVDKDISEHDKLTFGGMYHHEEDVPPLFGLPALPNGNDLHLPRDTYLGANWNKSAYRKINLFTEWEHVFNDKWKLTSLVDFKNSHSHTEYGYVPQRTNISAAGTLSDGSPAAASAITNNGHSEVI